MGLNNIFSSMGPFLVSDTQEMGIAMYMLVKSSEKGRYRSTL